MFIEKITRAVQRSDVIPSQQKELIFRLLVTSIPLVICSIFLIALEVPILLLVLKLKKIENFKEFFHQFKHSFKEAILLPLFLVICTWILYGLLIYPREVHANMSMTSSADISCLRNTISTEYLKDRNLILKGTGKETETEKVTYTKSRVLVNQCFNEKRISDIFKALIEKNKNTSAIDSCKERDEIQKIADLPDDMRNRITQKLKKIAKYKELKENYCSADEYQLIYRIAYIVRNKPDFEIENIFKVEWLEKLNKKENQLDQESFKKYFFKKIRANDKNEIEKQYESVKGAGKSIMSGGQIVKYFAKVSRFFIVTLIFGQVYKFLDQSFDLLKESKIKFIREILNDTIKSKISTKIIEFTISIIIFFALYYIFEKFMNEITQAHAISIVEKLNSDSGYVFGINKKETQQLVIDLSPKLNKGENRVLTFSDSNSESAVAYRILLNIAVSPLLEANAKDEFFLSS